MAQSSANRSEVPFLITRSKQLLNQSYAALLNNTEADDQWQKVYFQKVRILAIGKSGAGKTTLIRLMVGEEGPQTVAEDEPGVQDINQEFISYSEEEGRAPLAIHDSNGIDSNGKSRVDEIRDFLNKRQQADDFAERVHIVWYVVSGLEPRCTDDGGVMKLIGEFQIPLLLIVTHNDYPNPKVTDASVEKLLMQGYGDQRKRKAMKEMMVRVSNNGVTLGENKELIIDESKRDVAGLELVSRRTQRLIDKRLRHTWIAVQAVDMDAKITESAALIAGYARITWLLSLPPRGLTPFLDPIKLSAIYPIVMRLMCRLWAVPPQLEEALRKTLIIDEGLGELGRRAWEDVQNGIHGMLALSTMGIMAFGGIAVPGGLAAVLGTALLDKGKAAPILVRAFSLRVVAMILYVKSRQVVSTTYGWNPTITKEWYLSWCEEFAHDSGYKQELQDFAAQDYSRLDTAFKKGRVKGIFKSKIVHLYDRMLQASTSSPNPRDFNYANMQGNSDSEDDDSEGDEFDILNGMEFRVKE